jgi:hypothetical protein
MDRYDEKKDATDEAAETTDTKRGGDILGLGSAPVPKSPEDPTADDDPASAAKRRARSLEEESRSTPRSETTESQGGSTSIDMGAGGKGNLINRD